MPKEEKPKEKAGGVHAGHRARMRQRFYKTGLDGFQDHEVLELLLYYAIPRRDVNHTAHLLLDRFGSLAGVLDAPEWELRTVPGIGPATSQFLSLIPQIIAQLHQQTQEEAVLYLNVPQDVEVLSAFTLRRPLSRSKVLFALLSGQNRVLTTYQYSSFSDLEIGDLAAKSTQSDGCRCVIVELVEDNTVPPSGAQLQALSLLSAQMKTLARPLLDYYAIDNLGHPPRSYARTGQLLPW